MKDYTVGVTELRDHYNALTVLKKTIRAQVKAEYEAKIDFEIQSRIEAAEIKFANHVAAVKERDNLPVSVIQDHVLRTRTWNRWERIRDLAGIPGEFVRAEDAREAKRRENASFLWEDGTLTVRKNSRGDNIEPLTYDLSTNRKVRGGLWWPDAHDAEAEREIARDDKGFLRMLSDEIQRQIDAGAIANPEEEG
ncbi:hypothetical protein SEA_CASSITA_112 [Microbacterium phage Cassita]|nr:hypothetical protein SEA_CASSITA_112 [Microbacterium phage Cassita]